ncbi:Pycsar system effector family protein [Microbacterium sp. F51-2R]|uniref:Pycsar system effector family protein n=1 Tax=Microbacterium sp. F51-2R TaxID=3445777 RepID=UPI003FA16714
MSDQTVDRPAAAGPTSAQTGSGPAPAGAPPRPGEATAALAAEMLAEVAAEIDRADQKASLLIGSLGIAFSIVLSGMLGGAWSPARLGAWASALWIVAAVAGAASVLAAALAVWPRLSKGPTPATITYWGQIRGFGSPQDVADALAERGLAPPERTYQQLLVLSSVAQRKYRSIRQSMVLAGIAGLAVVASFFLIL